MPERSTMIRVLFPGERDRGVRLQARYGMFRLNAAVINGNAFPNLTPGDVSYGAVDHSSAKDIVGRLGADLEFLVVGVSGHYGHSIHTTAARAATGTTPAMPVSYLRFERARVGADLQAYYDIEGLGGLTLRGEFIYASDTNKDYAGRTADKCRDIKSLGWYATLVQNIGTHFGVVFRIDQFDPKNSIAASCMDAMVRSDASIDKITSVGGGLLAYISGNLKATAAYEHIGEQGTKARDNDVFTLQLQAKF
jgi:hypothetical protein